MAISVAPLTTTVMNAVETGLAGTASGVNNAISRIAALLAIAVFGIVMSQAYNMDFERHIERLNVSPAVRQEVMAQRSKLAAIALPPQASAAEREAVQKTIGESFVYGFRWVMLLSAMLALASALSAWLMIDDRPGRDRPGRDRRERGSQSAASATDGA
jgi:sugar phosphate permease